MQNSFNYYSFLIGLNSSVVQLICYIELYGENLQWYGLQSSTSNLDVVIASNQEFYIININIAQSLLTLFYNDSGTLIIDAIDNDNQQTISQSFYVQQADSFQIDFVYYIGPSNPEIFIDFVGMNGNVSIDCRDYFSGPNLSCEITSFEIQNFTVVTYNYTSFNYINFLNSRSY